MVTTLFLVLYAILVSFTSFIVLFTGSRYKHYKDYYLSNNYGLTRFGYTLKLILLFPGYLLYTITIILLLRR